jgi:hypothetical protein
MQPRAQSVPMTAQPASLSSNYRGYPVEATLHARIPEPWIRHRYARLSDMPIYLWGFTRVLRSIASDVVLAQESAARQTLPTAGAD